MFEITFAKQRTEVKALCEVVRKHRLYLPKGTMRRWIKEPRTIRMIAVAYVETKPVGCIILRNIKEYECNIGVFVRKAHRRKGIGKALVQLVQAKTRKEILPWMDRPDAEAFYESIFVWSTELRKYVTK